MKRIFAIITALSLLMLCACASDESGYTRERIQSAIGIDVSSATMLTSVDSHEGFHGDGAAHVILPFADDSCLSQIEDNSEWKALPLTENLTTLVYGMEKDGGQYGPYITFSDDAQPALPQIENGYYFFLDRHSSAADPHDDSAVFDRGSFNLTIAVYDTDSNTLHYLELDT